jgi:hypothetical protein
VNEFLDLPPGQPKGSFSIRPAISAFYGLVVFNNVTGFDSNYQLVRHVFMMDTTFPHNHGIHHSVSVRVSSSSSLPMVTRWLSGSIESTYSGEGDATRSPLRCPTVNWPPAAKIPD